MKVKLILSYYIIISLSFIGVLIQSINYLLRLDCSISIYQLLGLTNHEMVMIVMMMMVIIIMMMTVNVMMMMIITIMMMKDVW